MNICMTIHSRTPLGSVVFGQKYDVTALLCKCIMLPNGGEWVIRRKVVVSTALLLVACAAIGVGINRYHAYQMRPRAKFGYFSQSSNHLLNTGTHFSENGILSADFHFVDPVGGTEHITYSLYKKGNSHPLYQQSLGTLMNGQRGRWAGSQFPITHYPKQLSLKPGKYVVDLYYNGTLVDSGSFDVDKSIVIGGF